VKRGVARTGLRCSARARTRALLSLSGLLLSLAVLLAACADDDGDAAYGALHGTVRDAMDGKRLKGVSVEFVSDTLERASDTTDSEGKFSFDVVSVAPSGRLTAEKSGYERRVVSVFLDDSDVTVDLELERE